jgi:excisionase family DNA binding protein
MEASLITHRSQLRSLSDVILDRQRESLALLSEKTFSVTEVSNALGVHRSTLRGWLHTGLVRSSRTGRRGRLRIPQSELERLLRGEGQP